MKGLHKVFEFKSDPKLKNTFGAKGISFHKLDALGNYIANVGGPSFIIFNVRTKKIIKRINIPESSLLTQRTGTAPRTLVSWTASYKDSIIAFLVNNDPNAYHYDFKRMRMVSSIKMLDESYY